MIAFNVYKGRKLVDTVFYDDKARETATDVKRSLVNHDGYDHDIRVVKARKKKARANPRSRRYARKKNPLCAVCRKKRQSGVRFAEDGRFKFACRSCGKKLPSARHRVKYSAFKRRSR